MLALLSSICATLLGAERWTPNHDRLMTMVEWQGGPQQSWIPLYKPVMTDYAPHHISNEIILFALALLFAWWGYKNRHHKADGTFARIVLGLCGAGALYILMLWGARQHVEGDWKAVPPRLRKTEVDTPEFLEKQAASQVETEAILFKVTGYTKAQRDAQWERMSSKAMGMLFLYTIICAFAAGAA